MASHPTLATKAATRDTGSATKDSNNGHGQALKVEWVTGELHQRLLRDFSGERTGWVRVSDKDYFLPSRFATEMTDYLNFEPRATDTWIVTYPRSGTTWTQEMIWLLANDLDYNAALATPQAVRFPFFEFGSFFHEEKTKEFMEFNAGDREKQKVVQSWAKPGYQTIADAKEPRFIKTHLPFTLLPKNLLTCGAKIIYVARNPKDVAVSFFHLSRSFLMLGYNGDFETFWNYFQNGNSAWAPYWSHLEEGWQLRHHPRVLFMFYEDICKDTPAAIRKMGEFIGKRVSPDKMDGLVDFLSIDNFRKNPSINWEFSAEFGVRRRDEEGFVRKGKVGGHAGYFTPELESQADKWIKENLAKTDMRFPDYSTS